MKKILFVLFIILTFSLNSQQVKQTLGEDIVISEDNVGNVGFTMQGRTTSERGFKADSTPFGASLILFDSDGTQIEHNFTNDAGQFDLTGGTYESLFTDSTNSPFTQDDADNNNWIVITDDSKKSAMAQIDEYIDASNVILHTMGWTTDLSDLDYQIIQHPDVIMGDGEHMEYQVGDSGHFDIHTTDWVANVYSNYVFESELDAGADNVDNVLFDTNANGYNSVNGLTIDYESGDLGVGETGGCLGVRINVEGATSADATTIVDAIVTAITNGTSATTNAIRVLPGYSYAFRVQGDDFIDPDYGYENTSTASTDRVNGGTADTQAFLSSSASNLEIFDNDDDYILIGSDDVFEIINCVLTVGSSKNITADYFYSKAGGNWTTLVIQSDGTNGFQRSGTISFADPGDWTKDDEDMNSNAITEAYYVAIQRTYSPTISQLPTENYFETIASQATGMSIDGNGFITPRISADADAPNSTIYYSTNQSKLVFKDSGGTVRDLW